MIDHRSYTQNYTQLWCIIIFSLVLFFCFVLFCFVVFFYLSELLFSGFLQFKRNFVRGQNTSKSRD